MQPKEPRKLFFLPNTFTTTALKELEADGYKEAWAFDGNFKNRVIGLADILQRIMSGSDHGGTLSIDSALASELKVLLNATCYLFNSTSFREGEYFEFDKDEINRRLGRK
jgi:hypothetical protein